MRVRRRSSRPGALGRRRDSHLPGLVSERSGTREVAGGAIRPRCRTHEIDLACLSSFLTTKGAPFVRPSLSDSLSLSLSLIPFPRSFSHRVNDELSSAAARRARKNSNNAGTAPPPAALLLSPGLPPATLTLLFSFGRAAFESLCERRAAAAAAADDGEEEEDGEEDPLASHVSAAVDAAARALSGLGAAASVVWRAPSLSPSSGAAAPAVAVAAALAAGWAPGAAGVVPCVSPRLGPWAELAAVMVVGGDGGASGGATAASGVKGAAAAASGTAVLYNGVRAPRASRRAAAPCASALAYARLVSRGSSGGLLVAAASSEAARRQQQRLSPSPPPLPALSASPPPASSSSPSALAPAEASSPVPVLSAFAPKTPPLPGSSSEEEEGDKMSVDEVEKPENEDEEAEIRRKTEARQALSPGHPFSYPPLMLRYLYSRSSRGSRRALEEAVEKVRARGGGGV